MTYSEHEFEFTFAKKGTRPTAIERVAMLFRVHMHVVLLMMSAQFSAMCVIENNAHFDWYIRCIIVSTELMQKYLNMATFKVLLLIKS